MISPICRSLSRLGLVLIFASSALSAAEAKWTKVTTAQFTVISARSEKDTIEWAEDFSRFVAAFEQIVPVEQRQLLPVTFVVFNRAADFKEYAPLQPDGKPSNIVGFFDSRTSWAAAAVTGARRNSEVERILYYHGVNWFLSDSGYDIPYWLQTGLAELFSTLQFQGDQLIWGRPRENHLALLNGVNNGGVIPLREFLEPDRQALAKGGERMANRYRAQSWALVHFMIFGDRSFPLRSLNEYIRLSSTSATATEAFEKAFGVGIDDVYRKLQAYMQRGTFAEMRSPASVVPELSAAAASPFEVQQALARVAIVSRRRDVAAKHIDEVISLDASRPEGYELRGVLATERQDGEMARGAFEAAAQRGSRDFAVYLALADVLTGRGIVDPSAADARGAAARFEQAINRNPRRLRTFQDLAVAIEKLDAVSDSDLTFLQAGRALFPSDPYLQLAEAGVEYRAGNVDAARGRLIATQPTISQHDVRALNFARALRTKWQIPPPEPGNRSPIAWNELEATIAGLMSDGDLRGIVALAEHHLSLLAEDDTSPATAELRAGLINSHRMARARLAFFVTGQRQLAGPILQEIIDAPDAPANLKKTAQGALQQVTRTLKK